MAEYAEKSSVQKNQTIMEEPHGSLAGNNKQKFTLFVNKTLSFRRCWQGLQGFRQ